MPELAFALLLAAAPTAAQGPAEPMGELCRREVVELHRFIEDWSNGRVPDDDATFARIADALGEGFLLVSPDGTTHELPGLLDDLRTAHGRWSGGPPGRIWIEDVQVRDEDADRAVVVYVEWQESDGVTRGRISSAVFRRRADAPAGVEWLHLHETWVPEGAAGRPEDARR